MARWLLKYRGMLYDKRLAIGVAAVVGLCVSSPARACEPALCEPTVRLFGPEGIEVATNLVYFKLLVDDPGPLLLRTRAGEPIAASVQQLGDDRVFAPDEPLAEGTDAELVYTPRCRSVGPEPAQPQPVVYAFHAGIAGQYEPRPGSLELTAQGLRYPRQASEASFVEARYYTPEVTGGAFHLMEHHATIDGLTIALGSLEGGYPGLRIQSQCAPPNDVVKRDTCGAITSVPPGDHVLEVWTHVIGQTGASERVRLEIDTRCNARCPEPPASGATANAQTDASTERASPPPTAADAGISERNDGGVEARAARIAPPSEDAVAIEADSCSVTTLAARPARGWIVLACFSWLAAGLRRRLRLQRTRGAPHGRRTQAPGRAGGRRLERLLGE